MKTGVTRLSRAQIIRSKVHLVLSDCKTVGIIDEAALIKKVQQMVSFTVREDFFFNCIRKDPRFYFEHTPGIGFVISLSAQTAADRQQAKIDKIIFGLERMNVLKAA